MSDAHLSHVEWRCRDLAGSRAFLEALFGWRFVAHGRRYAEADPGRGPLVALLEVEAPPPPGACQGYIHVADIDACLERAGTLGGSTETGRTAIPDYGWYARVRVPDGTVFGLFQAGA